MGLICRDFLVFYILSLVGLLIVTLLIEALLKTDIGSAFNIIPQIVAALIAGQRHGHRTGIQPESSYSWKAAAWMSAITIALSIAFATGLIIYMGTGDALPLWTFLQSQIVIVIAVIVVVVLIYLLVSRYFFGLGAKQGARNSPQADADIFR